MEKKKQPRKKPFYWRTFINEQPTLIADNDDGSQYVPIAIVEKDLTTLDPYWETENFKFSVLQVGESRYISGSLELIISLGKRRRKIVGAATKLAPLNVMNEPDLSSAEAIALSESIKNAAKKIGIRFGSKLNDRMPELEVKRDVGTPIQKTKLKRSPENATKLKPDAKIMQQYLEAIQKDNKELINSLTNIYDIKTE